MKKPFRFDGHGVNDAEGQRIATLYKPEDLYSNEAVREDFDKTGALLAASAELLDACEAALIQLTVDRDVDYVELNTICEADDKCIYILEAAIKKAKGVK